jgi:hypothetical protein
MMVMMDESQLSFTIAKLDVKEGDAVVVKIPGLMNMMNDPVGFDQVIRIEKQFAAFLCPWVKVIIIDSEADVSVISKSEIAKVE